MQCIPGSVRLANNYSALAGSNSVVVVAVVVCCFAVVMLMRADATPRRYLFHCTADDCSKPVVVAAKSDNGQITSRSKISLARDCINS